MDHFMVSSKLMIYLAVFNHNYMSLGAMSKKSIIKLIKAMTKHQNLNQNSYFVDVGSGRGIPNLLVA